ncbi:MAG: DUF262 domain-containing HNH endonuclease family protein [Clostridium sp.]|nr:DUF262 domain-containing HNH endonuclease family protein [Clostridium sp.]
MKAVDSKISSFIGNSDRVFIIPPFQRNYAWSINQCEELFSDIVDSYYKNNSHYIGNIVYYEGTNNSASFNEFILIDGQQRITSILLLLLAIHNKLPNNDYNKQAIYNRYLTNSIGPEKRRVKLKQTENDEDIFDKIVQNQSLTEDEKKSKIFENYNYFMQKLDEIEKNIPLLDFYNTIGNLSIVDLNLQDNDLEAVQKIFEKINSTGKPLTTADLIRNYLLIAQTADEQLRLYKNYWVKIEELYQDTELISDFAKHYLITKRSDWVEEDKMYATFKSYFSNVDITKEKVLGEMLRLSKFYNWFKYANSDNSNINMMLKELNILKSDDMYCLLLIIFDKLYYSDTAELIKILDLLVDFMIRYRIVSLSNGSADLRSTLYNLLNKITSEEIELNYENTKRVLSNSPSPNGRFPNDEEFKNALQSKVNTSYAKALLYKMEYKSTRNIQVDIDKITIEHILPQIMSDEWKLYLGGDEKSMIIHNTYLNCVGNLAMLSASYNSSNSNKMWSFKKNILKECQFMLTQEVSKYDEWTEINIKDRNENLSKKAIELISGPYPREVEYTSMESSEEFTPGIYDITDKKLNVTGKSIKSLIINNDVYTIYNWKDIIPKLCEKLYEIDSKKLQEVMSTNKIHKSTSKRNYPFGKDPIFAFDKKYLVSEYYFEPLKCYVECSLSAIASCGYACDLLRAFKMEDKVKIELG